MKPGGAPRREFIPHTGDKLCLHHADPAVRRTRVWSEMGWKGGAPRERSGRQGRTNHPRSDHDAQTAPPITPRKLWENDKTPAVVITDSQAHRRMHTFDSPLLRQPALSFLPSQPSIRPRTTASPLKALCSHGRLRATGNLPAAQHRKTLGIPARHLTSSSRPTSALGAESGLRTGDEPHARSDMQHTPCRSRLQRAGGFFSPPFLFNPLRLQ